MSELERLRERSLSPTWSRTTTLPASRRMFSLGALEEAGGGERAEMLQAGGKGAAESSLVGFMAHTPKRIDEPPACKSTYGTSGAEEVPEASLANWKQSGMETEGEKGINTFCEHQDNAAMPRTCEVLVYSHHTSARPRYITIRQVLRACVVCDTTFLIISSARVRSPIKYHTKRTTSKSLTVLVFMVPFYSRYNSAILNSAGGCVWGAGAAEVSVAAERGSIHPHLAHELLP